jgi:hypothetical protein
VGAAIEIDALNPLRPLFAHPMVFGFDQLPIPRQTVSRKPQYLTPLKAFK